jgi:hypothetical protein
MAKRWNGKKMSHGSKNLPRPLKTSRNKPVPVAKKKKAE